METVTDYHTAISGTENPQTSQGSQAESADLDALHALERALNGLSLRKKALLVGDEVEPLRELRGG